MDSAGYKRKFKNGNYCIVPQCGNRSKEGLSFHLFPTDEILRKIWEVVLKLEKPPTILNRVCSEHFIQSDFSGTNTIRRRLKKNVIPSLKLPTGEKNKLDPHPKKEHNEQNLSVSVSTPQALSKSSDHVFSENINEENSSFEKLIDIEAETQNILDSFIHNNGQMLNSLQLESDENLDHIEEEIIDDFAENTSYNRLINGIEMLMGTYTPLKTDELTEYFTRLEELCSSKEDFGDNLNELLKIRENSHTLENKSQNKKAVEKQTNETVHLVNAINEPFNNGTYIPNSGIQLSLDNVTTSKQEWHRNPINEKSINKSVVIVKNKIDNEKSKKFQPKMRNQFKSNICIYKKRHKRTE